MIFESDSSHWSWNIICLRATVATDGADAARRIKMRRRRPSSVAFRDPQPPRLRWLPESSPDTSKPRGRAGDGRREEGGGGGGGEERGREGRRERRMPAL
ncbi:hypothetical protein INR49_021866 [Caranx melampygus]|nr:hypothetical protein INR49_021866 [Caranx melampygus]